MHDETENTRLPIPVIGIAVCTGVLLVLGIVAVISVFSHNAKQNSMNRYIIGEATDCGYIGIRITYDEEPVDVRIQDPYGRSYSTGSEGVLYEIDKDEKTVTLLADSDKTGVWSAEFNTKSNKDIRYSLLQMPSETLYIVSPVICRKEDGSYCLKFSTTMSDEQETTAVCNLTLSKASFSYGMDKTDIRLNQETEIPLEFPEHAFTDEYYNLRINLSTESGRAANTEIQVHLNEKPAAPETE